MLPPEATVANLAWVLTTLPRHEALDAMRSVLAAVRRHLVEQGWSPDDAADYAHNFGDAVVERLLTLPPAGHA